MKTKFRTALKIAIAAALLMSTCGRVFAEDSQTPALSQDALKALVRLLEQQNVDVTDSFKRAETLEDALKASCRVSVNGARGTGTFVGIDKTKGCAVVLTNYHVVTTNNIATLDFWTNSVQQSVGGRIYARFYDKNKPADFALIAVDPLELARINPPFVALAGADGAPSENSYIISAGCPKGRFVQAWKGKTLQYYRGKTIEFKPGPVPGQSGSGVLSYIDGELWLTAVLTWLIGTEGSDDSTGGAIPISILYDCLDGQSPASEYDISPIPPGAQECAEKTTSEKAVAPCVIEFTQANCPPCVEAEDDVAKLRALNVPVYVYDVATEYGAELAKRYGVDRTPSFVLLSNDFDKVNQFIGAGKADAIFAEYRAFKSTQKEPSSSLDGGAVSQPSSLATDSATSPAPSSPSKPTEAEPTEKVLPPLNLPELAPLTITVQDDFRKRPPVYEIADTVGIFEDSDARWKQRKGLLNRRENEKKPNTGNNGDDSSGDETSPAPEQEKKRPRIGEKLTDGAIEAITSRVQKQIDERLQTMKDDLREKWEAVKFSLLMGFCLLIAVGVLIAEGLILLIKYCWSKVKTRAETFFDALEAAKKTVKQKEKK